MTGKRRYDRKQAGFGGQTKPVFKKKVKTTKKVVLKLKCKDCSQSHQAVLKRYQPCFYYRNPFFLLNLINYPDARVLRLEATRRSNSVFDLQCICAERFEY